MTVLQAFTCLSLLICSLDIGGGDWFRIAYEGLTEDKKHWKTNQQRYVQLLISLPLSDR